MRTSDERAQGKEAGWQGGKRGGRQGGKRGSSRRGGGGGEGTKLAAHGRRPGAESSRQAGGRAGLQNKGAGSGEICIRSLGCAGGEHRTHWWGLCRSLTIVPQLYPVAIHSTSGRPPHRTCNGARAGWGCQEEEAGTGAACLGNSTTFDAAAGGGCSAVSAGCGCAAAAAAGCCAGTGRRGRTVGKPGRAGSWMGASAGVGSLCCSMASLQRGRQEEEARRGWEQEGWAGRQGVSAGGGQGKNVEGHVRRWCRQGRPTALPSHNQSINYI